MELTFKREPRVLAEFAVVFHTILEALMACGFNLGMLTFRTLNKLPASEVHTPFLESLPLKQLPAWDTIEHLLAVAKYPL